MESKDKIIHADNIKAAWNKVNIQKLELDIRLLHLIERLEGKNYCDRYDWTFDNCLSAVSEINRLCDALAVLREDVQEVADILDEEARQKFEQND